MKNTMQKFIGEINTRELVHIKAENLEVVNKYDYNLFAWLEDQYLKGRDIDTPEIAAALEEMAIELTEV